MFRKINNEIGAVPPLVIVVVIRVLGFWFRLRYFPLRILLIYKILGIGFLLFIFSFFPLVKNVFALSCAPQRPFSDNVWVKQGQADAIFVGKVSESQVEEEINIEKKPFPIAGTTSTPRTKNIVEVEEVLKGDLPDKIVVRGGGSPLIGGVTIQYTTGSRYLFYVEKFGADYSAIYGGPCTSATYTTSIGMAGGDLFFLRIYKIYDNLARGNIFYWGGVAFSIVAFGFLVRKIFQRKRSLKMVMPKKRI